MGRLHSDFFEMFETESQTTLIKKINQSSFFLTISCVAVDVIFKKLLKKILM